MKRLIQISMFLGMGIMARSQGIDSIVVSNSTPTWNDTIEVICYATYPTFACPRDSSSWFGAFGNAYILQSWHCMGPLNTLCFTADTFNLPMPFGYPGNYTIYYMTGYVTDTAKPLCTYPLDTAGNPPPYPYAIGFVDITVTPPVGIEEQSPVAKFAIYPNPASEFVMIAFQTKANTEVELRIHNSIGQLVRRASSKAYHGRNVFTVDIRKFASGVYAVSVDGGGNFATGKLVKQ